MILGRYLLTNLGLDFRISEHATAGGDRSYEGFMAPMVNMSTYKYEPLNPKDYINPVEQFMDAYVE